MSPNETCLKYDDDFWFATTLDAPALFLFFHFYFFVWETFSN